MKVSTTDNHHRLLPAPRRLDPDEQRLLELIAAGATNTQIATFTGRSPNTVKTEVSRLLYLLGANSRQNLVWIAVCWHLLPIPERPPHSPHTGARVDAGTRQAGR